MKRLAAAVCACVLVPAAMVLAGTAGAAVSPKLAVTPTNSTGANLIISGGSSNPSEDPFAKIQIYVPTGFGLNAPAGGATVGTVSARGLSKDIDPSQEASYTGKIVAIGLTDPAVAYENANCDNTAHSAVWMMQLSGNSGQVNVPIFVDKTAGTEAAFGPYKLVMCLRSPDVAGSDPNRSPTGFKLDNFLLTLTGFTNPTKAGDYLWRSLWTPYTPGTGTVNTAGSVEAQSIVRVPAGALAIAAKKTTMKVGNQLRKVVVLSGKLVVAGEPASGYKLGFSHGATKAKLTSFGSVKTSKTGSFVITSRLNKATYFQAGATIPRQELGPAGCKASFGTSVSCLNSSISGARVVSRLLYVR